MQTDKKETTKMFSIVKLNLILGWHIKSSYVTSEEGSYDIQRVYNQLLF